MASALQFWAALHTLTAGHLRERWLNNPVEDVADLLLSENRYDSDNEVWTVESELEFVRLIGGLQWLNPRHQLWFRGERYYFPRALPRRYRSHEDSDSVQTLFHWLSNQARYDRAIRDRGSLARAAILQHYGCATSLLDLTMSYDVACAFATESEQGNPHVRVYALPRHADAVTVFDEADIAFVDLRAALPSYCLRPHVQQAGFVGRREAVYQDILPGGLAAENVAAVDELCIAHIRLQIPEARHRFYCPRTQCGVLYPPKSTLCDLNGKKSMDGDYLLCLLEELSRISPHGIAGFPDKLSENSPTVTCRSPAVP